MFVNYNPQHNHWNSTRSKALLIIYLKSNVVNKAIFGDDGWGKLLSIICGCIIPQEQRFRFYLQKGVRHFETTTSSGHEGTNQHAIKSGPSCVLLQHTIDNGQPI